MGVVIAKFCITDQFVLNNLYFWVKDAMFLSSTSKGLNDSRNPAVIADNVGDSVSGVAGMGADLFESFVGSIIVAATLASDDMDLIDDSYTACLTLPF